MSNLNLQTLPDLGVPGATITLPMPGTVPEGLVDRARAAANGNGPAPAVAWKPAELTGAVVELSFLDQQKLIIAPEALVDVPPSICVVQVIDSTRSESDAFVLVSGVVVIDVEKMGAAASVLEKIWPKVSVDRFGKIVRFVVASNGLHIETELTVGGAAVFRRFRLGAGARVQPEKGKSALLVWQQVTWRDASLASLVGKTHKNPVDRLNEVMTESDRRLDDPDQRLKRAPGVVPVARIDRFDLRSEGEGSVFVDVRNEVNAQGTEQPTQARERISPAWALAVGGADWVPRSLTVVGDDLSGAVLTYSDGEDSFEEPATFSKENLTSLSWNWKSAELSTRKHVYPLLSNLATSPPLLSTGEFPGAGVNSPYLWQMTRLVVGKAQSQSQRVEPGVWIRYRLDPLAERETALTRQPDIDAGLSRPLRIEGLSRTDKDSGSPFESWILDLGLLPDGGPAIDTGRSRIRLELQPVTGAAGSESRAVALTLIAARIRATTPPMLALRDALVDPAAMPNRANKLQNLYSNARIVLANDREDPSDVGPPTHALEANHDAPTGALRLQALANARDVVVTYVPGPLAGLDLVSRARGNLTPLQTANPNDRPIPDWVREYEAGRVAVHLLKNIDLRVPSEQNANNPGEVRVVTLGDEPGEEVFMPGSESIATLFPWALSVTKQGDFKAHELTPFHRNLSLEAQEWALSAPDRHDPLPVDAHPTRDPRNPLESSLRDFQREEALAGLEDAVRDRFARATVSPLSITNLTSPIANWLPGAGFQFADVSELTPQLTFEPPDTQSSMTARPKVKFSWKNAPGELIGQDLELSASPPVGQDAKTQDWMTAWLRWTDEKNLERPVLRVDVDGRAGSRRAANSAIPLLEHRTPITAVSAGWLAGRMWVIFAVESEKEKLFAWEPLTGKPPQPLKIDELANSPINLLAVNATEKTLVMAVVQGSACNIVRFSPGEDGPIGNASKLLVPVPQDKIISVVRLADTRLFVGTTGTGSTLFVYEIDNVFPVNPIAEMEAGPIRTLDIRAPKDSSSLTVAVANSPGKVRLYHWNVLDVSASPTHSPEAQQADQQTPLLEIGDLDTADEEITAVAIQPLPRVPGAIVDKLFVYAATRRKDKSGRIVAWKLITIPSSGQTVSMTNEEFAETTDGRTLLKVSSPIVMLLTDPVLNDNNALNGGAPAAHWLAAVEAANTEGQSSMTTWAFGSWNDLQSASDNLNELRPRLTAPVRFGDHEGNVAAAVFVPGRSQVDPLPKIESPQESRFGAWMVTGGADGTVRVWDPETGVEKFRHTATSTNGWLDLLGVMRTKSVPTKQTTSFWAEPISVPDEMGQRHDILMLSTLGKPVDLFEGATLGDTDFALRFLCQDLPLMLDATQTNWQILPWNKHKFGRSFLHGVFGCDSGKAESPVPRLAGIPIEIVKLEQIELLETLKPWPNPAQFVTLSEIEFSAVLANPADPSPKGHTTPPDPEEVTTIGLRFKRKASGNGYDLEVKGDSRFDWRFPLTEQSPVGTVSVLPGRLARLEGSVTLVNGRLQLTPESTFSTADALGHLRPLENPPVMVFDPGSTKGKTVRFREKALPEKAPLELLGNGLPHPFPDKKIPIVATDLGNDSSEAPVVLLAAQPAEKEKAGRMLLADLATGRRRVRYGDTLRRARLVSEPLDDTKQRLTVVGIADDGTVRIRRLFEIEKTLTDGVKEKEVAADQQEWARFALPSPAEDVQVFDVLSADRKSIANRWLLARCRDGSAWLWNAQSGAQRYELSIPGTAVSVVAFGPAVPQEIFEKDKTDYDPWRDVFGTVSPRLIEKNGLEAFVAIGGNDGSVRIYAVDRTAPPALVRSFFVLDEPIQSLSLAIDKSSFEALTLRRVGDRTKPLPGLVLLACDGNGPCRLHEILSGLSLIEKEEADRPEVLRKETSALRGVLIPDNTTLHIVVETVRDDNRSVVSLMKKTKNLRTSFDASDIHPLPEIPQGVATELVRSDGPLKFAQCLAVNTGESGWSVYEFGGNGFTHLHEEKVNIVDAAVIEVFEQRYLVAVQSEGQLSAWVQTSPSGNAADWKPIVNPVNDHPVRVDAATFGRVVVPMVACRGVAGHLGHAWGIDLDSVEFTWPETLGPVEDSALVAMTCLRGVPLLAVASPRDVTVWDLATGLLVHRLGLDQSPVKLDMASDLDTLWLLVSDKKGTWRLAAPAVDSSFSPPLKLGSRTDFVEMRLMCLPAGLRLVTVGPDVANSNTLLDVTIPKKELNATSLKSVSVTMSPVDCRILDVTVVNNEFWVLLANSTGLRVIQLKTAGADFSIPVVGNSPNTDPVAAVFDLDPDPADSTLPRVWTVDESWTKITAWRKTTPAAGPPAFSKQDASSFERGGRHSQVTGSPKTLGAVKCDGRTRLVALAEGGLAVWDVADQALVRSEPLERAECRLLPMMALSAVVAADAEADCVRLWDQESGRLRQRLFTNLSSLSHPAQLAEVSSPTRPRLVVAGREKGAAVYDLYSGTLSATTDVAITSLSATLDAPDSSSVDKSGRITIASVVEDGTNRLTKVWRQPLGSESTVFSKVVFEETSVDLQAVALYRLSGRTLLAQVGGGPGAAVLTVRDLPVAPVQGVITPTEALATVDVELKIPSEPGSLVDSIRLSPAIDDDCVQVAILLKAQAAAPATRVVLYDLPLRVPGATSSLNRPSSTWVQKINPPATGISVAMTADGPRVVAGTQAFRAGPLLRIVDGGPPLFDLPVTLLPDQSAFLKGRITLSRRLDLQITLDSGKMGLPGISGLTARAALIQGEYSCFLIDSIERDDFRLTGSLVLWEDIAATSDGIQGMLVVEDTRPISASRQRGDAEASIVLPVPKGQQPAKPITAVGARVRMRAIPFNSQSKTLDSLDWREVLSWQLAGNADDLKTQTEWHLSDLVLIKPKGSADSKTGPHVARGSLSSSDAPPVQGDFLTSINRSVDGGQESYKLELVPAVYAARVYQQPSPADFGTTRDDVVYPAGPEGSVGLAFDLMEPRPALGESAQADPAERLQLCALLIKDSKVQLLAVDSASIPFDLNSGSELLQPLSLQPLEVPQLVHREAFGARIRGRWRPADEQVGVPDATGEGADLRVGSTDVWLLSPLATTPRGVTALTLNVLVRSQGRSLDWTRLETEGLIAIHRHGGALFSVRSDQNALAIEAAPSVENLSTLTVLRSGAGGSQSLPPLFDDARVQEYAAGIGSSGVLVVRSADARGRVSYRFVNSLTHSLVPPATKQNKPSEPSPHTDLASAESDPRILPPADVAALETSGTPRYQPAQPLSDRPDSRGFRRPGSAKEESVNGIGIHIAEIPALRGAERPLKPLAGTTSSPSNDGAKPFLPSSFELAFALDKPGAVFHQVVRCFAPNRTSSATTFARREPQRFAPPTRAAMQLDAPSLERSSDRRTLKATVPWTETVGVVPVLESDFNIKLSFTNEPVNSPTFTLKEPGRAVLPISRLGERIQALPISGGSELVVPLTPFREGQSVEAFDFFLVTRAELTGLQLPNTTNTQVQPIFVALRGTDLDTDATRPPILLTDVMMEETAVTAGGYRVWRLKREKDKTPPFLTWLAKLPPLDDKSKIKLNLIWANSIKLGETTDAQKSTYVNAPKLYKDGLTLRDIRFQPQSPRLAAVLRLPEATGSGLLSTTREFTLFDGPAASAQTVVPSVELIGNDAEIRFQAKDCETIEFLDPLPAPTSGPSPGCGVILVKIFEDGATLTTDKVITPTP